VVLGFDEPFAHPTSSFNEPVVPPDAEADDEPIVQACFSEAWLPFVLGALSQLQLQSTWKSDDPEVVLLAQGRATDLIDLIANPVCAATTDDIAPYWDDPEGDDLVGNPEEGEGFPWFGTITIGEGGFPVFIGDSELSAWLIGAFIAIVSGEDKGVRFLTAAKRFRVALQTNDLGGAVEIFINGILVQLIDTFSSSPDLRYVDVITDGAPALGMGPEDARVELLIRQSTPHDGVAVPQLRVVRKRLWAGEIAPTNLRYNTETDMVQITFDDGATWVDDPAADPRHSPVYLMPAIPDARCFAAAGMVELVRQSVNNALAATEIVGVANGILAVLTVLSGGFGLIIDLIVAVAEALLAIGAVTLAGAFNTEAYDNLLCIFNCAINNDGEVTAADLVEIQFQVDAVIGGTVSTVMAYLLNLYGEVGLQNAGVVLADPEADCSGCACCEVALDGNGPLDWSVSTNEDYTLGCEATYDSEGDKFVQSGGCPSPLDYFCMLAIEKDFPYSIGSIRVTSNYVASNADHVLIRAVMDSTEFYVFEAGYPGPTTDDVWIVGGTPQGPGTLTIRLYMQNDATDPIEGATVEITKIEVCPA
jgi:hypothetical protein